MRSIKAHMDYILCNGAVEAEDEQGRIHQGKEEVRAVCDDWRGGGIRYENGTRREAFSILLSVPSGSDRPAVKNAVPELSGNHQDIFAAHDDEKHPYLYPSPCSKVKPRRQLPDTFIDHLPAGTPFNLCSLYPC